MWQRLKKTAQPAGPILAAEPTPRAAPQGPSARKDVAKLKPLRLPTLIAERNAAAPLQPALQPPASQAGAAPAAKRAPSPPKPERP